jgi:hypothetical protein
MQMDELIAFVRRCLDEDERVALQMTAEPGGFYLEAETESVNIMTVGAFVHRWNPKRVLAEVEAKRAIIEAEQDRVLEEGPLPERMRDLIETDVLRLLAQPYAGQDGWREEWQLSAPP